MIERRLGEILIARGLISEDVLTQALASQKKSGEPLGEILVQNGVVGEEQVAEAISEQLAIPYVKLSATMIDREVLALVSEETARRLRVLPLFRIENSLSIAMAEPSDVLAIDRLRKLTGLSIQPSVCSKTSLLEAINRFYRVDSSVVQVLRQFEAQKRPTDHVDVEDAAGILGDTASGDDTPVVNLLNLLILQALRDRASDIHIEPDHDCLRVRYRVDGVLREVSRSSRGIHPAVVSRLKILSKLDVAEKRLPQDGSMSVKHEGKPYDLRVSILPTVLGEKAVIRILDKGSVMLGLDKLSMPAALLEQWKKMIDHPDGIVLVTGPTGSGKTTTLYASLSEINELEVNIVTVEDPVEYGMPIISQVQTNKKAGLDFAAALRSILRQDPDIVMIGEIRDLETAEIAIRAALTGHFVLSTLHTNDTTSTITRIVDMGVQPYLVAASVRGILAQRLIRKICGKCRAADPHPRPEAVALLGGFPPGTRFYRGAGCHECRGSGYAGRVGLYELLELDDEVRGLVTARAPVASIRAYAEAKGMITLLEDGIAKITSGVTTVDEVVRVTRGAETRVSPPSETARGESDAAPDDARLEAIASAIAASNLSAPNAGRKA